MEIAGQYFDPGLLVMMCGIIIGIVMLLRQISRRHRQNEKKQRQFEIDRRTALEGEHKQQMLAVRPKAKVSPPKTRVPLGDPFGTPFTGNIQGSAAKWEVEIHQIGRQIIGQIDSKMAALQAITLDANRTANRLEMLVEHLEQIARQQIEWQQNQLTDNDPTERSGHGSTVIPATESTPEAAPLAEVLNELTDDRKSFHQAIRTTFGEQPGQATILRLSKRQGKNLRDEVVMFSNYGFDAQEIARRLDISPGEVDVMLQVLQNR